MKKIQKNKISIRKNKIKCWQFVPLFPRVTEGSKCRGEVSIEEANELDPSMAGGRRRRRKKKTQNSQTQKPLFSI